MTTTDRILANLITAGLALLVFELAAVHVLIVLVALR